MVSDVRRNGNIAFIILMTCIVTAAAIVCVTHEIDYQKDLIKEANEANSILQSQLDSCMGDG